MIGNDKSSREEKCLWYSGDLGIRKASMILLLLHETKRRQLQTRLRDVLRVVLRVSQLKLPSYHGVSLYLVRVLFDGESLVATSEKINNRLSFIFSSDMYIIVSRCTQVYTFLARLYLIPLCISSLNRVHTSTSSPPHYSPQKRQPVLWITHVKYSNEFQCYIQPE